MKNSIYAVPNMNPLEIQFSNSYHSSFYSSADKLRDKSRLTMDKKQMKQNLLREAEENIYALPPRIKPRSVYSREDDPPPKPPRTYQYLNKSQAEDNSDYGYYGSRNDENGGRIIVSVAQRIQPNVTEFKPKPAFEDIYGTRYLSTSNLIPSNYSTYSRQEVYSHDTQDRDIYKSLVNQTSASQLIQSESCNQEPLYYEPSKAKQRQEAVYGTTSRQFGTIAMRRNYSSSGLPVNFGNYGNNNNSNSNGYKKSNIINTNSQPTHGPMNHLTYSSSSNSCYTNASSSQSSRPLSVNKSASNSIIHSSSQMSYLQNSNFNQSKKTSNNCEKVNEARVHQSDKKSKKKNKNNNNNVKIESNSSSSGYNQVRDKSNPFLFLFGLKKKAKHKNSSLSQSNSIIPNQGELNYYINFDFSFTLI